MWLGFSSPNPFPGNVDLGGAEKIKLQFNIVLGERGENKFCSFEIRLVLKRALDNFLNYFVQECMCIRNLWQGPGQWRLVKITLLNFSKFSIVNSFRWTSLIWQTWCNEMLLRCFILNAVFNTGFPASVKGNLINVAFCLLV